MHLTEPTDPASRSAHGAPQEQSARLRVEFRPPGTGTNLPDGLLAVVQFGDSPNLATEALRVDVNLASLLGAAATECWYADGPVTRGATGDIRYATDGHHLFGVCELEESALGGISGAAQALYSRMRAFQEQSGFPHLLRMWNYMDGINQGDGDLERYRQFCVGRGRGLGDASVASYPAATAIGHQRATGRLQVYWLASRAAGKFIENPRQVSAYRYPHMHGPVSPSFARATLTRDGALLISGTASIVGHLSRHAGEPLAQLDETLQNLAVLGAPVKREGETQTSPASTLLKVYVREEGDAPAIAAKVAAAFPHSPVQYLAADICRRELLLEIELVKLA